MKNKTTENKYWENEEGETVDLGKGKAVRCYDKAGKLQFGFVTKKGDFIVECVVDREGLLSSKEGMPYLRQTLDDWADKYDN